MHACRSSPFLCRWTWALHQDWGYTAQLCYWLLGQVIDEKLVTLQLARCISWVAIRHLAPLSTDEDLGTGVLLCGSGHGRLWPGLQAFHALLGGGHLAFEWGGGGLNTLLGCQKCTLN